jgi:transposase
MNPELPPGRAPGQKASDLLIMSQPELNRCQVLQRLQDRQLRQHQAAELLGVTTRQVRRLVRTYQAGGAPGLISKRRGRPSNRQLDPAVKTQAGTLLTTRYADFGPTLAQEKLLQEHGLRLSTETVRQLLIEAGLWHPKRPPRPVVHQMRERRPQRGELVQIDGSPHAWFEDRGPRCTLLVYIDDATGRLQYLQFVLAETTWAYMEATTTYLQIYGKPRAFYSDKHSIFRVNASAATSSSGLTQFGRALDQLAITLICAHSPQAKGRVERANQTLQDRLVKELRLQGIDDMAAGNRFLPSYMTAFNAQFPVPPRDAQDAHRPLLPSEDLSRIFTLQETRVLSKNLSLQYHNVLYQIQSPRPGYALRQARVLVCEDRQGQIRIEYKGQLLPHTILARQTQQATVVPAKLLDTVLETAPSLRAEPTPVPLAPVAPPRRAPSLAPNHPWRRYSLSHRSATQGTPVRQRPAALVA